MLAPDPPLRPRAKKSWLAVNRPKSRVRRVSERAPCCPRPALLPRTWPAGPPTPPTPPKELAAKLHVQWLRTVQDDLILYTDGSKYWEDGLKLTGWGFVAYRSGAAVHRQGGTLHQAEVFDAEVHAAREAARWAAAQTPPQPTHFCSDNVGVVRGLVQHPSLNSQHLFLEFREDTAKLPSYTVRWVPGHTGVNGNEEADKEAKAGALGEPPEDALSTLYYVRRTAKAQSRAALKAWWAHNPPSHYPKLGLVFPWERHPPELSLPRLTLHRLLAERTGHGDFAEYHRRFGHPPEQVARYRCRYGAERAPLHFARCPRLSGAAPPPALDLVGPGGHKDFEAFVKKHDPYTYEDGRPWA